MRNFKTYIIVLSVFFTSACMTEQKAVNYLQGSGRLPVICATKYPLILDPVKPGKLVFIPGLDTVYIPGISVPCPPGGKDTVYLKCPPLKVIHDTMYLHDTIMVHNNPDQINDLLDQLGDKTSENMYLKKTTEDTQKRANGYLIGLIATVACLVLSIIYNIRKRIS